MPKIIGGSLHEHREQTRQRLFEALARLMAERGFDAITLAEIAGEAGVGRTAVYNHFADKEALLLGFITHETEEYARSLQRLLDDTADPVEQLRTYVRAQASLVRQYHVAPGPELRSVLSRATQQRVREHAGIVEQVLRDILSAGIASGAFPEQDLDVTVPLVNACLSGRGLPEDGAERERAVAQTESFVLRAVGVDASVVGRASDEPDETAPTDPAGPAGPGRGAAFGCPVHAGGAPVVGEAAAAAVAVGA
ncbi:TetR family transcriptional regulator [Cellulomonas composti]|uniref:TetR family transcriptional regulator n=1 Tax=Cellulomonas composti TaxID=266130 RepID=A0A511JEK9_9CELL|nr:TetR family transcriptional regulator [Cellulomonas composti]